MFIFGMPASATTCATCFNRPRLTAVQSVCVRPEHVQRAATNLRDSSVLVCAAIGFPEGTQPAASKVQSASAPAQAVPATL